MAITAVKPTNPIRVLIQKCSRGRRLLFESALSSNSAAAVPEYLAASGGACANGRLPELREGTDRTVPSIGSVPG